MVYSTIIVYAYNIKLCGLVTYNYISYKAILLNYTGTQNTIILRYMTLYEYYFNNTLPLF